MSRSASNMTPAARMEVRPGIWLDSRLALWISELRVLVIADLHWGYVASHRAEGNLLPAWGDADIARRLDALVRDYDPAEMVWLGDSLHTLAGAQTAEEYLRKASLAVTIVSGNHDARWSRAREHRFLQRGNFTLHHGDRVLLVPSGSCEIVGHLHPAVSWADGAGMRLKMPALVTSDHRLVLPAFSPWAAGVPWKKPLPGETIYAISSKRIFTVPYAPAQKEPRAL